MFGGRGFWQFVYPKLETKITKTSESKRGKSIIPERIV